MRNLLFGEQNELHNRYLHISGAFQKQDIEKAKQDIRDGKQDIEVGFPYTDVLKTAGLRRKSIDHVKSLFAACGYDTVFGRGEVTVLLGLTPSPASELLRRLVETGVIRPVSGMGKGRYCFAPPES